MHSTSVVFAPSLQGGKQEAVLGLHDTWSTTQTHRPPPPLMVMIAAMLRSPHLDAVRLAAPLQSGAMERNDTALAALWKDRKQLVTLVAAGDDDACSEAPLVPVDYPRNAVGNYQVYHSNRHTFLQCYCAALRTGNATALGTALQRVIKWYEPLRVFHPTYMNEAPFDLRPVSRHSFTPKAICDVLRCGDSQEARDHGTFLCVNEMARVLRQCRADRLSRQAPLRTMGDIRCLLAAHSFTDASVVVQRVVREFDLDDAIGALAELGHADMGSMVLAAVGDRPLPSSSTAFTHVYQETRAFEIRYIASRGLIIKTPLGEPSLMAAHDSNGDAIVHVAPPLDGARHHLLLHTPVATQPGTGAYRDRAAFDSRWTAQLRGILDGWDWSHCVAAGGAVVRALVGRDGHDDALGDVDLFFYGLTYCQVRARLSALERHVEAKVGPGKYAVLLTSKTMTIITEYAPRLQVALGMWSSASDVLTNCDVDCCGAGYDGARVVLTGRAAMAYAYRVNVGTASSHRVRGSIVYETRLWKYAQRYGFAVLDPLHAPDSAAVVALRAQLGDLAKQGPVAAARHVATSLTGLRWLTAADLGLFTPTLTTALPNGVPLEEILQRVTAKGYVESDNYGCVVVQPAAATDPFDTAFLDTEHYFDHYTPLTTATFANRCALRDLDDFEVGDHVEMGVLEPRWNLLLTEDSAEEDA